MYPLSPESGVLKVDISKQQINNRKHWQYVWRDSARRVQPPELIDKIQQSIKKHLYYFNCMKIPYIIVFLILIGIILYIIQSTGLKDDTSTQTVKTLFICEFFWCISIPIWAFFIKKHWIKQMKELIQQMKNKIIHQGYQIQYQKVGCCYTRFMILFLSTDQRIRQKNLNGGYLRNG